jgi:hypothetical protein
MPAFDDGDDFVGICDPLEGFCAGVVVVKEAVDCGLEIDHGLEDARLRRRLVRVAKKPSTALSQEAEVKRPARMAR